MQISPTQSIDSDNIESNNLASPPFPLKKLNTSAQIKLFFFLGILLICITPIMLNMLGVDFSSSINPIEQNNNKITANDLFYALAGALQHTILEWTAVILALLTFLLALMHYRIHKDIAIPIIGMAIFCAGSVDAFHTLAATRIISAQAPNTDFIPFTWAFSRIFNAFIMITGTIISIYLYKRRDKSKQEYKILMIIGLIFFAIAYTLVHIAASSNNLPQTMFPEALITRPYDVLPLGLFIFAGSLFINLYKQSPSLAKYGLLMSIIPEIATQFHMAFGSTALFDNHFNIAHSLKIFAYGCVFLGILLDLKSKNSSANEVHITKNSIEGNKKPINLNTDLHPAGHARFSIGMQIPIAAFSLSLSIAILVSFLFYFETQRLLVEQTGNELAIESNLVEPIIEQLYQQAQSDILFLSKTPPVLGMLNAFEKGDKHDYQLWQKRLEQIFTEFIINKSFYYQVRYIGITDIGKELVNVRGNNQVTVVPQSRLQIKKQRPYFKETININPGQVYFSKVELAKNNNKIERPHKVVLRVSTPIYHPETGISFGIVVINIDFDAFIVQLKNNELSQLHFYLANNEGDFIYHPETDKKFKPDLDKRYLMQNEFPLLANIFKNDMKETKLKNILFEDSQYIGHFKPILSDDFGHKQQLNLLVLKSTTAINKTLQDFRMRSLLLGSALALVALAIAIFAARSIAQPLQQITKSLTEHTKTNKLSNLPLESQSEIGVLARSFSNLFKQMQHAFHEQQESALFAKQSAEKINAVFMSAAEAFITINDKGFITSFNRAAEVMFGYREAEIIGQNISGLMPKNYAINHDDYINHFLNTGEASIIGVGRKLKATKKSGEIFPIHLAISKINTEDGAIFTGIVRDISKEAQLELEQEINQKKLLAINERMSLATDAAGIGIWQYDLINDKLSWDNWMFNIYDIDKKDFSGTLKDWQNTVHKEDIESANNAVQIAIDTKTTLDHEFRIIHKDGKSRHIKAIAIIKNNKQDEPVEIIGVNFDITSRKEVELEHIAAKELAENTTRHKAEFLASMSHEIRTPMNGILGMLGLLMRNELSEEQMHRVKLANSSAEALLNLINDILDFSKVEAGKLDLEEIDFDLRKLFGEFSESLALKSQEKNIEIILDNRAINQSHVIGDPGRIRQILNNLTGNAIKFTNSGEIVITAALTEDKSPQNFPQLTLECSIKDTGIGIPNDKVDHLFDSFTQVDASTTRKYGGTGLGLAISKQLCHLMQGDISVDSTLDHGSTFSFKVKLKPSLLTTKVLPSVSINDIDMLVVDDNATNRLVLREQLEYWGANVEEATNGLTALELLENTLSKQQVSQLKVAFLDMNMPHMDGAMLAKAIKSNAALSHIKLVMMTSMAARGDAKYFSQLGFCAYFPKPAITNDLFKALKLCISQESDIQGLPLITHHSVAEYQELKVETQQVNEGDETPFNKTPHQESPLQNCQLLLVEDNRINQEVARHVLAEFGITPVIANNGREALDLLLTRNKDTNSNKAFDVILMDCQMPEMDGYQATQAIRKGQAGKTYQDITIIAMTANAMKGDKEKCLAAGMTDYLSKPIEPLKLKDKLIHYTHGEEHIQLINNDFDKKSPVVEVSDDSHMSEEKELWHKSDFAKRLNHNEMIQQKLLLLFIDEMPKQLAALTLSIDQGDSQEAHNINHKIQGMSANISAITLTECCKSLASYTKVADIKAMLRINIEIKTTYALLEVLINQHLLTIQPKVD